MSLDKQLIIKSLNIDPSHTVTHREVGYLRHRVNIYKTETMPGCVVPKTTLFNSYYIEYDGHNIKDLTIRA